jgi:hypothetical protein
MVHDLKMKPFPAARMRALRNLARSTRGYRVLSPEDAAHLVRESALPLRDGETLHGVYEPPEVGVGERWALSAHTLYIHREGSWEIIPLVDIVSVSAIGRPHVPKTELYILGIVLTNGDGVMLRFKGRRNDLWIVWTYLQRLADLDQRDPR